MKKNVWIVAGGIVVCTIAFFFFLTSSLWFFTALFPDDTGEVRRIGYIRNVLAFAGPEVEAVVEGSIPIPKEILQGFRTLAYQESDAGEVLVGVPKIQAQLAVSSQLQKESWSVHRMGMVLIAQKHPGGYSGGVFEAMGDVLKKITLQRLPVHPAIVFQFIPDQGTGEQPVAIYVEKQQDNLHAVITTEEPLFSPGKSKVPEQNNTGQEVSFISLQTDVLARISKSFRAIIQSEIAKKLGFEKTNPDILGDLLAIGPMTIAKQGDALAIGIFSTDNTVAEHINSWISLEQSVRHPVRRAFALPDRTIGYEYIPGAVNSSFSLNKGKNNCFPSEGYDEEIFLCGQDRAVVFASEEAIGDSLVSFLQTAKTSWQGHIDGNLLNVLGLGGYFDSMNYSGEDNVIDVWAKIKNAKS